MHINILFIHNAQINAPCKAGLWQSVFMEEALKIGITLWEAFVEVIFPRFCDLSLTWLLQLLTPLQSPQLAQSTPHPHCHSIQALHTKLHVRNSLLVIISLAFIRRSFSVVTTYQIEISEKLALQYFRAGCVAQSPILNLWMLLHILDASNYRATLNIL